MADAHARLREKVARHFWQADCEEDNEALRRARQPVPEKWADPWEPLGCGVRQQKQYYRRADAILALIATDEDARSLVEAAIYRYPGAFFDTGLIAEDALAALSPTQENAQG